MLAKLGFKVKMLMRTHIGKLTTKGLGPGQWRKMDDWEIKYLQKAADERESTK
jgi:16S rRNA U516 pseudouridylate synthase RsuA-like enzyme